MIMMTEKEFYQNVADTIINYLPEEFEGADISLSTQVKTNDIEQTGLQIRLPGESISPIIYLSSYYEQYKDGEQMPSILSQIADTRTRAMNGPVKEIDTDMIKDYDNVRPMLQMRIYDTEKNGKRLENIVHHSFGDFSTGYSILLNDRPGEIMSAMVTPSMMDMWGITKRQLHEDTIQADLDREPTLTTMKEMMNRMFLNLEPNNYLETPEAEKPSFAGEEKKLFVLSNKEAFNGAGLILNPVIQEKIAAAVEGNYYVIPSSIHEVLIIPDGGDREGYQARELNVMVHEINRTTVAPAEVLSDKVQYYDAEAHTLSNALVYERAHTREPEHEMQRGRAR